MNRMATDKKCLTIEVTTHVGPARLTGDVWSRDSVVLDARVERKDVVIDPYDPGDVVDAEIRAFQLEHGCKVAYLEDDSSSVRKFDVFEPAWPDTGHATLVGSRLLTRLTGLARGRLNSP